MLTAKPVTLCNVMLPLLLALTTSAAGVAVADGGVDQARPSRGAELLLPYKQQLQSALLGGMSQGVVEAIAACRLQAPAIAQSLSHNTVQLGRTSHRLRNPENAAPDWVAPLLQAYLAAPADRAAKQVALDNNRSGYVEPIVLQPMCTACHGQAIAPEVAERLAALYPRDQAVGFMPGELRGVFWVEYAAEP